MVKIRLTRFGRHKTPFYRIVAVDSRKRRDSDYLVWLGTYNPDKKEIIIKDEAKVLDLLAKGAQPAETVKNILKAKGIWAKFLATKKPKAKKAKKAKKATKKVEPAKKEAK